MKYFFDTEFLEGKQTDYVRRSLMIFAAVTSFAITYFMINEGGWNWLFAVYWFAIGMLLATVQKYAKTPNTIDLISIGIVSEDNREYYEVSKDFNLKEAWNRYDKKINKHYPQGSEYFKEYWIRENVLKPIFNDFLLLESDYIEKQRRILGFAPSLNSKFTYKNFKRLLKKYGKSNKEIAKGVRNFIMCEKINSGGQILLGDFYPNDTPKPQFYAYYADYDWVVFCWLFGRMIDLPKCFPMYCNDLKQIMDSKVIEYFLREDGSHYSNDPIEDKIRLIENFKDYPKQTNEHNALADAKWNEELYKFLNKL